jgi:hypothetical protein
LELGIACAALAVNRLFLFYNSNFRATTKEEEQLFTKPVISGLSPNKIGETGNVISSSV